MLHVERFDRNRFLGSWKFENTGSGLFCPAGNCYRNYGTFYICKFRFLSVTVSFRTRSQLQSCLQSRCVRQGIFPVITVHFTFVNFILSALHTVSFRSPFICKVDFVVVQFSKIISVTVMGLGSLGFLGNLLAIFILSRYEALFKGIVSQDGYFLEGQNILISSFCVQWAHKV